MQESLETALNVIFKGNIEKSEAMDIKEEGQIPSTLEEKFRKASDLYNEAQEALQQGDFSTYAQKIEELGRLLGNKS